MEQEIFSNAQVDLELLPSVKRVEFHRLHPDYKVVLIISVCITYAILLMGLIIAWAVFADLRQIFLWSILGVFLLGIISILVVNVSFPYKAYAIRQKDLIYKSGWLSRRTTILPFNRVQHLDIKQGLIDRSFGLAKLNVYTAGGQSSDLTVPGLLLEDAQRLKSFVLQVVSADEEE